MADFNSIQQGLHTVRENLLAADKEWLQSKEQAKKKQSEIDAFQRTMDPQDSSHQQLLGNLKKQKSELDAKVTAADQYRAELRASDKHWLGELKQNGDPVAQLANLDSNIPILLFPLRIETRFKTVAGKKQLWVRVYPDDCQVEAFSELLSQSEHKNAINFWCAFWAAGKQEEGQRAAWRKLVAAHGSGRAGWIIEHFVPLNPVEQPVKNTAKDWFLVVYSELALSSGEESAAKTFWENYWTHEGNKALQQADIDALAQAAGASTENILRNFVPSNFTDALPEGMARGDMNVKTVILRLPDPKTLVTSAHGWTQAPKIRTLPERFMLKGFANGAEEISVVGNMIPHSLDAGPDPSLSETDQMMLQDGEIVMNEELKWLTDFEEALKKGMAFRIDLTDLQYRRGFDKLTVTGVRFTADRGGGKALLKRLLQNHNNSKNGFSLLRQGTPTNNTGDAASGHSWIDDPEASYDVIFNGASAFDENEKDPMKKRDGQVLSEWLGIDAQFLKKVPGAGNSDQAEAWSMNTAMWEGTLGYFMDEMLRGVFTHKEIEDMRGFFNKYISARGWIPPVRIGRQPYGILPVTVWNRLPYTYSKIKPEFVIQPESRNGNDNAGESAIPLKLYYLVNKLEETWNELAKDVSWVGKEGKDVHQVILDIVGLHPGSVEFHQRYAQSLKQAYNQLALKVGSFGAGFFFGFFQKARTELLSSLGLDETKLEGLPVMDKIFQGSAELLTGPVVQEGDLSETLPLPDAAPNDKNYIRWLSSSALEAIRKEQYGPGRAAPNTLLYLMLRHSLMLTWWDGSINLLSNKNIIDKNKWRKEADFYNIAKADPGISRFEPLYMKNAAVTGDASTTVGEFLARPASLINVAEAQKLAEVKKALAMLADVPTARLERLFAEHIDLCSYRFDAWKQSIVHLQLEQARYHSNPLAPGQEQYRDGVYIGAYGWLENVKSENKVMTDVKLDAELSAVFQKIGDPALQTDSKNAGYLHAPSLNQAMTAAVLKNAYIEHASKGNSDVYAINLTSERVRKALTLLEGMRNGQRLSDLLGYMLERGLHDLHPQIEADKFIWPLRQAFPDSHALSKAISNDTDPGENTENIAMVINGNMLIDHISKHTKNYPFGLPTGNGKGQLPAATADEAAAIDQQVDLMMSANDAVADLLTSESIYQVVKGNFERSAASANVLSQSKFPPDIEVVKTPRSGITITHRVAVHLDAAASTVISPNSFATMTPRAQAEAPLNKWLSSFLPDPASLVVRAYYKTPLMATESPVDVTQADLGLQPIDLLYAVNFDLEQAMTEMDDRILRFVQAGHPRSPGATYRIDYTQPVPGFITFFEAASLIRSLRNAVLHSRPLHASDPSLPNETKPQSENWDLAGLKTRTQTAIAALGGVQSALAALEADMLSDADTVADSATSLFLQAAMHGIPQTGTGHFRETISALYNGIQEKLATLVTRWNKKKTDCELLLAGYAFLAEDSEKYDLLKKAERIISTTFTEPLPDTPAMYKSIVDAKKTDFDTLLANLEGLQAPASTTLTAFLALAEPLLTQVNAFDVVWFDTKREKNDLDPEKAALSAFRAEVIGKVTALKEDIAARIAACNKGLTDADAKKSFGERRKAIEGAYRKVLGDEFTMFPTFLLEDESAAEAKNVYDNRAQLLNHITTVKGHPHAVDEWMYGVARVREKMHHWENLLFLSEAFGKNVEAFTPLQFPFKANDSWLALEYPPDHVMDTDKVLYTAQLQGPLVATDPLCGFLLDGWTEVIPGSEETTGVAFHYDQPNQEPPQALLLSVSPELNSKWKWNDLEASIHQTFDMARKRAVEPTQVDTTLYGTFLPATMMAVTRYLYSISNNLALNNNIYEKLK